MKRYIEELRWTGMKMFWVEMKEQQRTERKRTSFGRRIKICFCCFTFSFSFSTFLNFVSDSYVDRIIFLYIHGELWWFVCRGWRSQSEPDWVMRSTALAWLQEVLRFFNKINKKNALQRWSVRIFFRLL
jgi:hypothetical protein